MPANARDVAVFCRWVTKTFGEGNAQTLALRGVDLDVYAGQMTLLVGPSGCGKTTLLSIVAATLDASSGSVAIFDQDLGAMSGVRTAKTMRVKAAA